jgi:HK97 family phage prohead protease
MEVRHKVHDFETRVAAVKREIRARSWDGIERRTVPGSVEARDLGDGKWQIAGYGFVYNSWSVDLGGFKERIAPGAADDVLASNPDIRGLVNHNPDLILGRTVAGTMVVTSDTHGGAYVIDAPATSYAADLRVSLDRRDINQSSFAFRVERGGATWEDDPEDEYGLLRTITKFSGLYDMSPVTYPAYEATSSGVASSVPNAERNGDGPAGERTDDGDVEEQQTDGAPWRLRAAQRGMARRESA